MSNLQHHLQKETENLRLTHAEKTAMRLRLQQAMGGMPVSVAQNSPYTWMFAPRSFALLSVALLVAISSGTAYAAEGSLPGGVLYPVKINVIEPLTVALAPTPAAKAQANATIATTRVQEAETLASDGNLTPAVAAEISTNYNEHATAALALAADADARAASSTPNVVDEATTTTSAATSSVSTVAVTPEPEHHTMSLAFSARIKLSHATTTTGIETATTTATSTDLDIHESKTSLVNELHTSLSAQAEILDRLNAEVHMHQTKTPL